MRSRWSLLFVLALVLMGAQDAEEKKRASVQTNLNNLATALQKRDMATHFSILPWDRMQSLDEAADKAHGLASLVECNFTCAGFVRVVDLPACEKLGLRAIVFPDVSLKLDKTHHLSDAEIDQAVRTLVEQTSKSNACVGYFVRDEPGTSQFEYLAKIVTAIHKYAPGKIAYINLFPGYATLGAPNRSQLEARSYSDYLERYVTEVKPQILSYDNYAIESSHDMNDRAKAASFFQDLLEVRRVALKHDLPFWVVVASNQIRPVSTPPSPSNLLLQGWTTIAAGGHGVSWFKYQPAGYRRAPLDKSAGRTTTWTYLQMVNRQLKTVGPIVGKLRSTGVYFTGPAPLDDGPTLPGKLIAKVDADAPLMVGEFASHDEVVDHAVLVNLSLERSAKILLNGFNETATIEEYSAEDGHLAKCGPELYLPAGQGVLIRVTR